MCAATEHMLAEVWAQDGVRDVYADFNELTLNITTNALFGVDMSSSQAAGISGECPPAQRPYSLCKLDISKVSMLAAATMLHAACRLYLKHRWRYVIHH